MSGTTDDIVRAEFARLAEHFRAAKTDLGTVPMVAACGRSDPAADFAGQPDPIVLASLALPPDPSAAPTLRRPHGGAPEPAPPRCHGLPPVVGSSRGRSGTFCYAGAASDRWLTHTCGDGFRLVHHLATAGRLLADFRHAVPGGEKRRWGQFRREVLFAGAKWKAGYTFTVGDVHAAGEAGRGMMMELGEAEAAFAWVLAVWELATFRKPAGPTVPPAMRPRVRSFRSPTETRRPFTGDRRIDVLDGLTDPAALDDGPNGSDRGRWWFVTVPDFLLAAAWAARELSGVPHAPPPAAAPSVVLPAASAVPRWAKRLREVREDIRDLKRRHAVPPISTVLIQRDDPRVKPHTPPDPSRNLILAQNGDDTRPPHGWVRLDGDGELCLGAGKLKAYIGQSPVGRGEPERRTGVEVHRAISAAVPPDRASAERFGVLPAGNGPAIYEAAHAAAVDALRSLAPLLDEAGEQLASAPADVRAGVFHTVGPDIYEHADGRCLFLWAAFDLALRGAADPELWGWRQRAYDGGRLVVPEPEWASVESDYAFLTVDLTPPGWWYVRLPDLFTASLAALDLLADRGEAAPPPPTPPIALPAAVPSADTVPRWVRQMRDVRDRMREAARRAAVPPVPAVMIEDEPDAPGPASPHPADCAILTRPRGSWDTPHAWTRIDDEGELTVGPDERAWVTPSHGHRPVPGADPPAWEPTAARVYRGVHAALPPDRGLAERHRAFLRGEPDPIPARAERVESERLDREHRAAFEAVRAFVPLLDEAGRVLAAAPAAVRSATFATVGPDLYDDARPYRRRFLWAVYDLAVGMRDEAFLCARRWRAVGIDGGCGRYPEETWKADRARVEDRAKTDPPLPYRWPGWFYIEVPDLFGACIAAADLLAERGVGIDIAAEVAPRAEPPEVPLTPWLTAEDAGRALGIGKDALRLGRREGRYRFVADNGKNGRAKRFRMPLRCVTNQTLRRELADGGE